MPNPGAKLKNAVDKDLRGRVIVGATAGGRLAAGRLWGR